MANVEEPTSTSERIRARADALGFDAVGFARADEPLEEDFARYERFRERGMHGEMGYLAAHGSVRRRLDGAGILPGARTVVCLARRYDRDEDGDPPLARAVARYARGRDYHNHLARKLRRLAAFVRGLGREVRARPLCDTAPVLERAWAARAGMGFVGKNGLLIVPGKGSYCLLGEVVTTLEVEPSAHGSPLGQRCGSCTACLEACPTDAFDAPYVLDPRRCISYLTIERRSVGGAEPIGEHLFGCDACQSVCPYNAVRSPGGESPFSPLGIWERTSLADLVACEQQGFDASLAGSPVRRAGRSGLARNALHVAAARLRRGEDADARAALEAGRRHDDPDVAALARALTEG